MHYRLLDFLACPLDNSFPLEISQVVIDANHRARDFSCRNYCGYRSENFSNNQATECQDCSSREIVTATLTCPQCGNHYPVKDGIPRLVPPFLSTDADVPDRSYLDKRKEMTTRDMAARQYDRMRSLAVLSRMEKPVTLEFADVKQDELVVELGSGTGRFTIDLAEAANEVVAVDFSAESLKVCREKTHPEIGIHLIQADISHLPFREKSFDKAVSCQVFEHLPSTEMRQLGISEASRVLKADGELTISVYRQFWFSSLIGGKEGYHAGHIYYYRFTPAEFKSLLGDKFEILSHRLNVGNYLQLAKCRKRS